MKKVGFIGATDKTDLIVYVAKVLEQIGKRVIVVDTTILQKSKYVVPSIDPTRSYVTDFDNVDFAIGFENMNDIGKYLGIRDPQQLVNWNYDYMLIDIDRAEMAENFELEEAEKKYFVTTFDIYSLKRGVEVLKNLPMNYTLSRILINYDMRKEDKEYLDYLTIDAKVIWDEFTIYVPLLDENQRQIEDDQRVYKARLKRLIPEYQESIIYIVQSLVDDLSVNKIKKIIKE